MQELIERIEKLEAREAIRNILHSYARAADRRDEPLMASCYWEDALDDHGFFSGGKETYAAYVIPQLKKSYRTIHSLSNTIFDFSEDGKRCFTETYFYVLHRIVRKDGINGFYDYIHNGRYIDIHEKRDGVWKIFRRKVVSDADNMHKTLDIPMLIAEAAGISPENLSMVSNPEKLVSAASFPDDVVYKRFEMVDTMEMDRQNPDDLWASYYAIAPKLVKDKSTDTSSS